MAFQDNPQSILSFRVGPVLCCAPSLPVESIISPPKLTHPPGSDRSQPGIFRHGAHIVKVIDLRQRFGIEPAEQTTPGNLIITHFDGESYGFWVDQILDVFDFPSEGWGALPAAIPRGVFSRTLLLNKKIHLYAEFINFTRLNDLGYLKHYIHQLKQGEEASPGSPAINNDIKKTASTTLTDKNNETNETVVSPPSPIKNIGNTATGSHVTPANKTRPTQPTQKRPTESRTNLDSKPARTIAAAKVATTTIQDKTTNSIPAGMQAQATRPADIATQKSSPRTLTINSRPVAVQHDSTAITPSTSAGGTKQELQHSIAAPVNNPLNASTNAEKIAANPDKESTSPALAIIFLLLLLVVSGAGIYLFLFPEMGAQPAVATTPVTTPPTETPSQPEAPEENLFSSAPETTALKEKSIQAMENETPQVNEGVEAGTATPRYQAEISHKANEIMITIHEPEVEEKTEPKTTDTPAINEIKKLPETGTQAIAADAIKQTLPDNSAVEPLKQDEVTKIIEPVKPVREIIHIVVKGDTLWAIARKYVHNPYLYPELARLSNIKNPHRIYPGDRVRIRFIRKQK